MTNYVEKCKIANIGCDEQVTYEDIKKLLLCNIPLGSQLNILESKLGNIENIINPGPSDIPFVKGAFDNNLDLTIYLFRDSKIICIKLSTISEIKIYKTVDISEMTLNFTNLSNSDLKIHFRDSYEIILSYKDANSSWEDRFSINIIKIFRILSENIL